MNFDITTEWSEADHVFVSRVKGLPGCAAHGATKDEARREAAIAAQLMLDAMNNFGEVPESFRQPVKRKKQKQRRKTQELEGKSIHASAGKRGSRRTAVRVTSKSASRKKKPTKKKA